MLIKFAFSIMIEISITKVGYFMKKNFKSILSMMIVLIMTISLVKPVVATSITYADDLFISEYVEGSSNNKAIEIYNGTGGSVDLSQYKLMKDVNGNGAFTSMYPFSGTLNNGETIVVANSRADQAILDIAVTGNINFNGDDQVALYKNDTEIDHIGISGDVDYGKDTTYVRAATVKVGVTGEVDPRDNSGWVVFPKNTFEYLGKHTAAYGSEAVADVTASIPSGEVAQDAKITLSTTTEGATVLWAVKSGEGTATTGNHIDGYEAQEYTGPITITEDITILAKAIKEGLEDSGVSEFAYTIRQDGEVTPIGTARSEYIDENNDYLDDNGPRKLSGVITETSYSGYAYMQDGTGAIGVKLGESVDLSIGDKVEVVGTVGSSYGFAYVKVNYASDVKKIGEETVTPSVVALADVGEATEASLITVENVKIVSGPQYGEYTVEAGNDNFRIKPKDQSWIEVGKTYERITGVVYYGYGKYALVSRNPLDIVFDSKKVRDVEANVDSGVVASGTEVTLTTLTEGAKIYYTTDGSQPLKNSTLYTGPIAITEDMTLKAIAIKEWLNDSDTLTRTYTVEEVVGKKSIPEIQGESHVSPYNLKNVEDVKGIVTSTLNYKFDFIGGKRIVGFYMQDETGDGNDATSDAIFVASNATVAVGDKVSVDGRVEEYVKEMDFYAYDQSNQLSTTSLVADTVDVISSGNTLPEAVILGANGRVVPHDAVSSTNFSEYNVEKYAIDFYESLESMRVSVENPLVVSAEHNRVLSVVPDNGGVAKADGDLSNMGGVVLGEKDVNTEIIGLNGAIMSLGSIKSIESGATSTGTVKGIMDYEWGTYQVYVTEALPAFTNVEREVDSLKFEINEDELTVGSYNVYNHGGDDNAQSLDKAAGIANTIVNGMKAPDIIGLVEVQDNDGKENTDVVDASQVYQTFIDEIKKLGGPEYAWTDIPPVDDTEGGQPGGNIRVGYLYNPARVSLKEGVPAGTSTQTVTVNDEGHLNLNPGRIGATAPAFDDTRKPLAAEFVFNGQDVIVVANHLSSKGGDNATYGNVQPAVKYSEVERKKQAQLVNDFVDDVMSKKKDANVVVLGDLNDFQFSNPVRTLRGEGSEQVLVDMIDRLPVAEQYTYNFGGNSQVLDHILVSNHLADDTRVDVLNINSIISDKDKARRHSDHDPVVVSIAIKEEKPDESLKDIYISKFDVTNLETGKDTRVFNRGDFINIKAGFTPYKKKVEKASVIVKLVRVARSGREIMLGFNKLSDLPVNMDGRTVELAMNTRLLSKGKYRLVYEVYNTTDGEEKLCDEARVDIEYTRKKLK